MYFHRFYRPVYNRYCYYYPRLYRQNPAYFRVRFPVLSRVYASGGFIPTTRVSKFVMASQDEEEPQSEDIPESGHVEAQNQLNKRDEPFEAEDLSFFCVRALAGQRLVASDILDRCREMLGLNPFGYDRGMGYDYPDLGGSIRSEVYRRLGRSFRDVMGERE